MKKKTGKAVFAPYAADVLRRPGTVVIFFWPRDCGSACKARQGDLQKWYGSKTYGLSTYILKADDPAYAILARPLRVSGNLDVFIKANVKKDGTASYVKGLVHPFDEQLEGLIK